MASSAGSNGRVWPLSNHAGGAQRRMASPRASRKASQNMEAGVSQPEKGRQLFLAMESELGRSRFLSG